MLETVDALVATGYRRKAVHRIAEWVETASEVQR